MRGHSAAGLVGPIVQAGTAAVLLVVFLLVLRFTARRRFTAIWLGAWAAHLVGTLPAALSAASMLSGHPILSFDVAVRLGLLAAPGQYAFVALVVLGALDAIGRLAPGGRQLSVAAVAAAAGIAVAVAGDPDWAIRVQLIATPILLFGTVQLLLRAARGPRARGVVCLVVAMTAYATVASAYLIAGFVPSSSAGLVTIAAYVTRYSGYADGITVVVLAGAVMVIIVQDAFLAAVAARAEQLQAVAAAERTATLSRVVSEIVRGLDGPISSVLLESGSLLQAADTPAATAGLLAIHRHAEHATHLIGDVEAYVRSLGRPEAAVDLADVARVAAAGVASDAVRRGVTLVSDLPRDVALVQVDRALIEQVIRGLLDNALSAAGQGGTVRVAARRRGPAAEVAVEDSGPGVPDELVHRLFDSGFTTKADGKASGLGLALFAHIARSYGGALRYEHRPATGTGARFVLTLPCTAGGAPPI